MITNLTQKQIESIQIDEGVIILDYGEDSERVLAPTRGGGEFTAGVTVRDIEFDGRHGKTAGTQVIEEQTASIKVTTLCMSQENLALAIPSCTVTADEGKTIKNPKTGVIPMTAYLKNVTMFAKTIGGKYKKMTIYNAMHETGFTAKAAQKAEGELALEITAHYKHSDLDGELWEVKDVTEPPDMSKDGMSEAIAYKGAQKIIPSPEAEEKPAAGAATVAATTAKKTTTKKA